MSDKRSLVHLVLLETSGNQRYIFATNKLREQVGASELIYQAGTSWVLDAVRDARGPDLTASAPRQLRTSLEDEVRNVPIERGADIEVILAASGKALLLVRDREQGKQIVQRVTERALREAPGLAISGVVSEPFDLASDCIHERIKKVHERHTAVRSSVPGPECRFQRLPIVAECRTSGGPARRLTGPGDRIPEAEQGGPISHASLAKSDARRDWECRLAEILRAEIKLPRNLEAFEQESWIAVIHADGNGLGQVFLNFHRAVPDHADRLAWNRSYINQLRSFSLRLDECAREAFLRTCKEAAECWLPKKAPDAAPVIPVIPLIMGGDDLTVICAGAIGLRFAATYAEKFEEHAGQPDATGINVSEIVKAIQQKKDSNAPHGLTCSVGVAIVKPHFPFHAAYDLAEALLRSAKQLKPWPAIDFQVVYDSSASTLDRARRAWRVDDGATELTARPYLLRRRDGQMSWKELAELVETLRSLVQAGSEAGLPRSQLQSLREALFEGRKAAEAQLQLIRHRYPAIEQILPQTEQGTLFFAAKAGDGPRAASSGTVMYRTHLLDLLEVEGLERGDRNKR